MSIYSTGVCNVCVPMFGCSSVVSLFSIVTPAETQDITELTLTLFTLSIYSQYLLSVFILSSGFRVQGFRVQCLGFRGSGVRGSGFRDQRFRGSGLQGSGVKVPRKASTSELIPLMALKKMCGS